MLQRAKFWGTPCCCLYKAVLWMRVEQLWRKPGLSWGGPCFIYVAACADTEYSDRVSYWESALGCLI